MGLAEDNQQLRKLARAVMRGELGRADYQQQRRRLINAHTGDSDSDPEEPEEAVPSADPTAPTLAAARIATTGTMPAATLTVDSATAVPAQGSDVWIGLVAVVLVVLVVAGALALFL